MTRYEKGKRTIEGIQERSVEEIFEGLEDIAPDLSRFVIEFPYSEIYTREELDKAADGAGEVRQMLTGLTPGAKYSVFYMVADYDDILKGVNNPRRHPLELTISGAELCRQSYYVDDRNRPALKARVNSCKLVFEPAGTEAELVFSVKHAEPGTRIALNYITVRRYFDE